MVTMTRILPYSFPLLMVTLIWTMRIIADYSSPLYEWERLLLGMGVCVKVEGIANKYSVYSSGLDLS